METRELRYVVAVADEGHFGRAAERLRISQPPLSRAIAQLERRLGTTLFERRRDGVRPTPAGEVLVREARGALTAVEAAERRTVRAGAVRRHMVVAARSGQKPAFLAGVLDAYAADPDALPVEVLLDRTGRQASMVRDGRADVAVLHLPFDDPDGLRTQAFCTEPQVAVLPEGHPLGARDAVRLADVAAIPGLPLLGHDDAATVAGDPRAALTDLVGAGQLVALGRACVVVPRSARSQLPADLETVPVADAPDLTAAIGWVPDAATDGVLRLLDAAERFRASFGPLVTTT